MNFAEHDLAFVQAVAATGIQVGYCEPPDGALEDLRATPPGDAYAIVYPLQGGSRTGPAGDPFADAELPYQVTVVAPLAEEARWLVGEIENALALLLAPGTITGRKVMQVIPDMAGGDVRRDRDLGDPPVFYATPRWTVATTPA